MAVNRRLFVIAAVAGLAACSDSVGPTVTGLQTDSSAYTATNVGSGHVEVRLVLTYRNAAETAVSLDRCTPNDSSPIYSLTLVSPSDAGGAAYNGAWACVGGVSPIVVAPLAARVDTITLHGPSAYDGQTQRYIGVLAGSFRIGYGGQVSNVFTIAVPSANP